MSTTIKEIAIAAGVSRGTVDRVINGRGGVKPEIEQKIKKLIVEMNYTPNRAGKVLAALKKPMKIGCFLPSIDNAFFDDIILGFNNAEDELADFGVSIELLQVKGFEPKLHAQSIKKLADKNVSALCVSTVDVPIVRETINKIINKGIPVIAINSDISETNRLCYVGCNYLESGKTAAGLLKLIHKDFLEILIITGSLNMQGHNQRIKGFIDTLDKNSVNYHIAEIFESMDDDETAYTRTLSALKKHNSNINCLYITAAGVTGACRAVKELNLQNKLTLITFDDVPSTKQFINEDIISATICQEPYEQGYKSIKILFDYYVNGLKPNKLNNYTHTVIKIKENI